MGYRKNHLKIGRLILLLFVWTVFFRIQGLMALQIDLGQAPTSSMLLRKQYIEDITTAPLFKNFSTENLILYLDSNRLEPRGVIKKNVISLSSKLARDTEFIKLFMHEFGHYIDIYILKADYQGEDVSQIFYNLSWKSSKTKLSSMGMKDFVSGYAAINQYEDFAETFTFYVFHNASFADLALKNEILRKKYLFFRNFIFPAGEFEGTDFTIGDLPEYLWDSTKIPFSIKKYLYFIR